MVIVVMFTSSLASDHVMHEPQNLPIQPLQSVQLSKLNSDGVLPGLYLKLMLTF